MGEGMHPRVRDAAAAIRIYREKLYIGNDDIRRIFRCGATKASRMKKAAQEQLTRTGRLLHDGRTVCASFAYALWGIDVEALERRRGEGIEIGIIREEQA